MSGSNSDTTNLLRSWMHPVHGISLPALPQAMQVPAHAQELPGASVFAGMSPEQAFWFQHLMGQGVGQPSPPGQVNPYYLMMMMQGPQGAIYPPQDQEGQQG